MKVYLDNLPMGDVPRHNRQPGEFFPRLIGFRVSIDGTSTNSVGRWASIEPIYIPVLRFQQRAGQVLIELNADRPLAYITLQWRIPFIHIFRFDWSEDETQQT